MKNSLFIQYKSLVDFLGETLGYDYEIVLYDLENGNNSVIALAHGNTDTLKIGDKLPQNILELLNSDLFTEHGFCTHIPGERNPISVFRNSYLLIKDSDGNLSGLLCIIFDDSRFIKLHDYLISLAHPLDFVKNHSFHTIHNMEMYDMSKHQKQELQDSSTNMSNIMRNTYRCAILQANLLSDRPTQEERKIVIRNLEELCFFKLKGAVPYAAQKLNCSSASIYRYLSEIRNEK